MKDEPQVQITISYYKYNIVHVINFNEHLLSLSNN